MIAPVTLCRIAECLRTAIAVVMLMPLLIGTSSSAPLTNTITREIRYENGDVWIDDTIDLHLGSWIPTPILQDILREKQRQSTDLRNVLKILLKGDDVQLVNYEAKLQADFMKLSILSKVKVNYEQPARLRCLASYAGYRYHIRSHGQLSEPYMLIYSGPGIRLLWFPEWDAPQDLAKAVQGYIEARQTERQFLGTDTNVLNLRCVLKTRRIEHVLFEATPWSDAPNAPDAQFLARIHDSHRMSGNDWRATFTDMKLTRAGYYVIDASGVTNRLPVSELSPRPLTRQELDDLQEHLEGHRKPPTSISR